MNLKDLQSVDLLFERGIDPHTRRLYLTGEINAESTDKFIKGLHMLERKADSPIEVWINSEGGSVLDGLAIYEAMRLSPCTIETVGTGLVASMANFVFLGGEVRMMTPLCEFMVHPTSLELNGSLPDIRIDTKRVNQMEKQMLDIYTERTSKRRQFWKGIQRNRYFSAGECLAMGICHSVMVYEDKD